MAQTVNISKLNPIRLREEGFIEQIYSDAFYAEYYQKYQIHDRTDIQVRFHGGWWNNQLVTVFNAKLVNIDTKKEYPQNVSSIYQDWQTTFGTIHVSFEVPEGAYKLIVNIDNTNYESDVLCIKNKHIDTYLFQYRNSENTQEVLFYENMLFGLRVEADMTYNALKLNSENTIYESDFGEFTQIFSSPYDTFSLNIGGTKGIPDYLVSTINRIFSCDMVFIKSFQITKIEGSEFEAVGEDNYNLRSWNIKISRIGNQFLDDVNKSFILIHLGNLGNYWHTLQNANDLSPYAKKYPIKINAALGYSIQSNVSWATVEPLSGYPGLTSALLSVQENNDSTFRTGIIKVYDSEGNEARINVHQREKSLTVQNQNPFSDKIPSLGVVRAYNIKSSSGEWSVVGALPNWIQMPSQGYNGNTNILFLRNSGSFVRVGIITLKNTHEKTCTMTFMQIAPYFRFQSNETNILEIAIGIEGGTRSDVMLSSSNFMLFSHNQQQWCTISLNTITSNPVTGEISRKLDIQVFPNNTGTERPQPAVLTFRNNDGLLCTLIVNQTSQANNFLVDNQGNYLVDNQENNLILY